MTLSTLERQSPSISLGTGLCADEMLSPPPLSLSRATNTDVPALCLAVPELLPVQVFRPALSNINTTDIHLFTLAALVPS